VTTLFRKERERERERGERKGEGEGGRCKTTVCLFSGDKSGWMKSELKTTKKDKMSETKRKRAEEIIIVVMMTIMIILIKEEEEKEIIIIIGKGLDINDDIILKRVTIRKEESETESGLTEERGGALQILQKILSRCFQDNPS